MTSIHAKESVKSFLSGVKTTITPEIARVVRRGYTRKEFTRDLMSGLIVGILALPLAIAFAIASGVGPEQGLYTAIIAGFATTIMFSTSCTWFTKPANMPMNPAKITRKGV